MREPIWLRLEVILAAHDEQLAEHGGGAGVRDPGLLESALARPLNLFAYGDPSLPTLAAAYAFGIARNHPFVDGNKRTAAVAAELFLGLNGLDLTADDVDLVRTFLALAAGEISEEELAAWIDRNCRKRQK
jgi:death-on-curing protein